MKWKPPEEWEKLKKGINCPMCADTSMDENQFNFLVKELKYSYVRLPKNQYTRGWTIVVLKHHASELFELSKEELGGFWEDVSHVAKALDTLYKPTKINYCVFGNHCPHIHCHLVMQTYDNDPSKAVKMDEQEEFLAPEEYQKMINDLKTLLD
jgi:diadenosine tetraphosphate (Ap4A) HIT family hydrolase